MKLQDSLLSSSSRRDQPSPAPEKLRAKSIGCMSALFRLVYHSRRRRFLTSGKEQESKNIAKTVQAVSADHDRAIKNSCGVPRSPTLPPDMRQARPPVLNDLGIPGQTTKADPTEVVAEKRRRLLGALEKCDEDLKTLKKIIEVVKSSVPVNDDDCDAANRRRNTSGDAKSDDGFHSSTTPSPLLQVTCHSPRYIANNVAGGVPQQQRKRPGEEAEIGNMCFHDRVVSPSSDDQEVLLMGDFHGKNGRDSLCTRKAMMVESVNEVCKDIEWGKRREIGRICLALQDHICRDLIEELVGDQVLGFEFGCKLAPPTLPLPFESCKKRLQF